MCVVGAFVTVVYLKRNIAKQAYFIAFIGPLFLIELALALFTPLSEEHFPGILLMPVAIVNVILLLAILKLIETNIRRRSE